MNNLRSQYHKALSEAYGISKYENSAFYKKLIQEKMQFVFLQEMINDNRHNAELTEIVLDKMAMGEFQLGMDAVDFFISCANIIFFQRLAKFTPKKDDDMNERMRKLHPLWGKSYMSF